MNTGMHLRFMSSVNTEIYLRIMSGANTEMHLRINLFQKGVFQLILHEVYIELFRRYIFEINFEQNLKCDSIVVCFSETHDTS